jgi:hypothetical protein
MQCLREVRIAIWGYKNDFVREQEMLAPLMRGITVKGTFVIELPPTVAIRKSDSEMWASAPFKIERRAEGRGQRACAGSAAN